MTQKCKVDGCTRKLHQRRGKSYLANGYCIYHYHRTHKGLPVDPLPDPRDPIICGDIAKIPLGPQGKDGYCIVDSDQINVLGLRRHITSLGYVRNNEFGYMHTMITGNKDRSLVCDHINGIKTDNRKENLRLVRYSTNSINRGDVCNKYDRCIRKSKSGKYILELQNNNKRHIVSFFKTIEEAIEYRDMLEKRYGHDKIREKNISGLI